MTRLRITGYMLSICCIAALTVPRAQGQDDPIRIGSRRELFVDDYLVENMTGTVDLRMHHPVPGPA